MYVEVSYAVQVEKMVADESTARFSGPLSSMLRNLDAVFIKNYEVCKHKKFMI